MAWNEPGGNGKDKNPWGQGGKQSSPPDLDEALRSLNNKLKKIFSGKGGGSGGSVSVGGGAMGLTIILGLIVVLWAVSGVFTTKPAGRGVILRFGKYVETVGPGLHWIPRFIESKQNINVQRISTFSYSAQMLTKDENIVSVSTAVQFRIVKPKDYLFNIESPVASLQQATASALRQVIGHTTLDQILTTGREEVRQAVTVQVEKIMRLYKAGIEVTAVTMQPAKAPEAVKAAFDDAIKAQEDEQRFINQAQAYANAVKPIARGRAKRIMQEAKAYKQQVVLQAKGATARFLAILPQYKRAPRVTRERMYIDALEKVYTRTSKILIDVKGSNNMFYLPLDRMLKGLQTKMKVSKGHLETMRGVLGSNTAPTNPDALLRGTRGRSAYRGRRIYE